MSLAPKPRLSSAAFFPESRVPFWPADGRCDVLGVTADLDVYVWARTRKLVWRVTQTVHRTMSRAINNHTHMVIF